MRMGEIYVILSFLLSFAAPPEGWPSHLQLHNPQENKTEKISSFSIEKNSQRGAGSWRVWLKSEGGTLSFCTLADEKKRILALDNEGTHLRNHFNKPRFLHLPIYRKALKSLT